MPKLFIFSMFYLSFAPLWLCTAFIDIMSLIEDSSHPWTEIIGLLLIAAGFLFSILETHKVLSREKRQNYTRYIVAEAKEDTIATTTYLLSNTLPLFTFDFTKWQSTVTFLIVFLVLLWLCVVHNRYDCNVCLELAGYRLFQCQLKRKEEDKEDILVLIRKRSLNANDLVSVRLIGDELYLGYIIEERSEEI